MRLKRAVMGVAVLAGCAIPDPVTKNGPVSASDFKVVITLPDQENADIHYEELVYSSGVWLQSASWGGTEHPLRLMMKVVDFNGANYLATRYPFAVSLLRLDPVLKGMNLELGQTYNVQAKDGVVSGQNFTVSGNSCLAFFEGLRLGAMGTKGVGDGAIHGYYCAPTGKVISERAAMKILTSIEFHK